MRYVLIIILMVILSAYFSASEISFNASNKIRLKKAAENGSRSAALAYRISEDFTTALSAILIGNNLANIAASTAATVIAMNLLMSLRTMNSDGMASFVSTVVMTVIILIFGEIVPKIIAKNNADSAVRFFAWPTRILTWILYPLVWLVMRLIRLLSSLWGKDDEDAPTVTEEELSSIIETAEEEGVVDEEKSELLQSAIDFRDTTVEEIMTPRIDMTAFDIADPPEEIEALVDESRYSRIPVYEDSIDNIIGILYLNHYYKKVADEAEGKDFDLRGLLMKPNFIHKTMKLPAALSLLRERKTHIAIVVDEFGGTLGLVTMEDILEELVGDIWDESDEIVEECVRTGENTYEVNGDMNIDDFFGEIEFEPREFECEYSTVGGWAIEMLDADPHVGDSFTFRDIPEEDGEEDDPEEPATTLTVVVSAMDDMRVTKLTVLVTRPKREDEDGED
ncbi:MAG: HlyC/CorC family transporter [Ruminococcaceae bacterium]|nr:HlyC/CorC family transporter [Oscillospiraceae bacterium]